MKDNKNIYEPLFDSFDEVPPMPEGLSKENMLIKLKQSGKEPKKQESSFKTLLTVAAVFAVIILSAFALDSFEGKVTVNDDIGHTAAQQVTESALNNESATDIKAETTSAESTVLKKAQSDKALEDYFMGLYRDSKLDRYYYYTYNDVMMAPGANMGDAVADDEIELKSESAVSHSQTNVQTEGVDEGDIIKNDGRYFYIVGTDSSNNKKLRIFDTQTMQYVYNSYLYDSKNEIVYIDDIYINGNKLIAMCPGAGSPYRSYSYKYGGESKTVSYVFDITDKTSLNLVRTNEQDGSLIDSRMIGTVLYTVTQYTVTASTEDEVKENYMPKVNGEFIGCDCIFIENENAQRYLCITAYDTDVKNGAVAKTALLSQANTVYCSENNLYTFGVKYYGGNEQKNTDADSITVINSFSLDGINIKHTAKGEIDGKIINQYCADEYDGYLRVATNYYNTKQNTNSNSLFVLDGELKVVGKIKDIAKTELIKSVRFMGKEGYVVTYRQIDPLFSIDLSNPKEPKIRGELKIPGYSTYLHPINETTLLGIGYDGDSDSANTENIKVSLFDISDMNAPKEIDSLILPDVYTEGNSNAKAFVFDSERGLVSLPVNTGMLFKCMLIKLEDGKLSLYRDFLHEADEADVSANLFRTAYIGDTFYCISSSMVTSYSIATGEKAGECKLY